MILSFVSGCCRRFVSEENSLFFFGIISRFSCNIFVISYKKGAALFLPRPVSVNPSSHYSYTEYPLNLLILRFMRSEFGHR